MCQIETTSLVNFLGDYLSVTTRQVTTRLAFSNYLPTCDSMKVPQQLRVARDDSLYRYPPGVCAARKAKAARDAAKEAARLAREKREAEAAAAAAAGALPASPGSPMFGGASFGGGMSSGGGGASLGSFSKGGSGKKPSKVS